MSDTSPSKPAHGLGYTQMASKWGWFVALGIVMILGGLAAFVDVVAFTLVSVIFIGAMLLAGGGFQVVQALATRDWRSFLFNLVAGIVYIVAGLLIMQEPAQGSLVLTLFVLAALLIAGLMRITIAVRNRELPHWWMVLLSGIVGVIVAVLLYVSLPWSGLWLLGALIAVELVVQGIAWLRLGLSLHHLLHAAA